MLGWAPWRIDWWSTSVQFVGTLFFNLSTFAAIRASTCTQVERRVWTPDVLGSICFLVASALAWAEAGHAWWSWRPRSIGWRIAALNLIGSIAFGVSAVAAYVVPDTGELLNTALAERRHVRRRRLLPRRGRAAVAGADDAARPHRTGLTQAPTSRASPAPDTSGTGGHAHRGRAAQQPTAGGAAGVEHDGDGDEAGDVGDRRCCGGGLGAVGDAVGDAEGADQHREPQAFAAGGGGDEHPEGDDAEGDGGLGAGERHTGEAEGATSEHAGDEGDRGEPGHPTAGGERGDRTDGDHRQEVVGAGERMGEPAADAFEGVAGVGQRRRSGQQEAGDDARGDEQGAAGGEAVWTRGHGALSSALRAVTGAWCDDAGQAAPLVPATRVVTEKPPHAV